MKKFNNFLNEYRMPDDIFKAIKTKNLEKIIENKSMVKEHSHLGYSTLFFSLLYGNAKTLKLLLELGADPNQQNIDGVDGDNTYKLSAFKQVISKNNKTTLKLFIKYGLDINQKIVIYNYQIKNNQINYEYIEMTSLDYAIKIDSHLIAKFLYESGIKISDPMKDLIKIFKYITYRENYHKTTNIIVDILTNNLSIIGEINNSVKYFKNNIVLTEPTLDIVEQLPETNSFLKKLKFEFIKTKNQRKFNL
jgi:ankyrin repeat protein